RHLREEQRRRASVWREGPRGALGRVVRFRERERRHDTNGYGHSRKHGIRLRLAPAATRMARRLPFVFYRVRNRSGEQLQYVDRRSNAVSPKFRKIFSD